MTDGKSKDSHLPPTDSGMAKEEFIRVGTTLYKIVEQPRLNGGYVKKRIAWNNETLRQDYGKDYIGSVPKYDGFCTVPEHIGYRSVVGKFLNLYEPIDHRPQEGDLSHIQSLVQHIFGEQYELGMDYLQLLTCNRFRSCYPAVGVGRTQHGQKHLPELSESPLSEQCHFQHQRGFPQPVQFRLGWQVAYRGG